ncbi:MAG: hypothetical protein IPP73_14370 [Chitinophagaceae bacterium]|nr:hypothetical protein [Chitinophagaceae bacterium]
MKKLPQGLKLFSLVLSVFCWQYSVSAQDLLAGKPIPGPGETTAASDTLYIIGAITITGNKKTHEEIILRELPFHSGEKMSLSALARHFEEARQQLMNTALFNQVVVAAGGYYLNVVTVNISVRERWYLFPTPYVKPVDRNLNQWIFEQHASLDRVNYGGKLIYNNITGNNDKLRLWVVSGYTRQISFSYERPYIDRQMKWGVKTNFSFGKNREINYNTVSDKQVFMKDEQKYVRAFFNAGMEWVYRPALFTRHRFGFSYSTEEVGDTVVALNPLYFKSGRRSGKFPELYYRMSYTNLDYIPYPTRGYAADIYIGKKGFTHAMNVWQLFVKGNANWPLSSKYFIQTTVYGGIKLPFSQPYFNQRFLGYGDAFMQGYEYYVVDGVAGGYLKTSLSRKLLDFKVKVPGYKNREETMVPIRVFGRIYGNTGYVYNPQPGANSLSNKMLYAGGLGLDIVTLYDLTIRLEWTFNQLGQNGVFLHRRTMF